MFNNIKPRDVIALCEESLRTSKKVYLPEVATKLDIPRELVKMVCESELHLVPSNADDRIYMTREDKAKEGQLMNAADSVMEPSAVINQATNTMRQLASEYNRQQAERTRQGVGQLTSEQVRLYSSPPPPQVAPVGAILQDYPPASVYYTGGPDSYGVLEPPKKKVKKMKVSFDSVILDKEIKESIMASISQTKNADLIFDEWGFGEVFEKGTAVTLLFYGVPGTGKTLMAQAIAEELGMELKVYGTAEIQSSEPGGAERAIKRIFSEAMDLISNKQKQRVILFDECDSLLYSREKVGAIMGAQINALLSEIEKFAGVIVFTTNRLQKLDSALERRISSKIEFPFPGEDAREKIWKRLIPKSAPLDDNVDFKKLARFPIAGGNIKNVVLNTARIAAYEKAEKIELNHFKKALEKEIAGMEAFNESASKDGWEAQDDIEVTDNNKLEVVEKTKYETKSITEVSE